MNPLGQDRSKLFLSDRKSTHEWTRRLRAGRVPNRRRIPRPRWRQLDFPCRCNKGEPGSHRGSL